MPLAYYVLPEPNSLTPSDLSEVYDYCDVEAPGGSISGSQATVPLDSPNGTGLDWADFDSCLSRLMETNFTSTVAPSSPPPVCSATTTSSCSPQQVTAVFSAGIVDSPRFGFVPLVSSRGTGTNAAPVVSWAGAYLDLGFPSTGNATTLAALQAWIFPLGLIEGDPSPSISGATLPYQGGPWGVALCSLTSGTR